MTPGTRTTCPYCGVGCGVIARRGVDGIEIEGDPEHPANHGRLCSKGAALGETLGLANRLLHPQIQGKRVTWDAALEHVAHGFNRIIDEHGPESVAFYVSGQLLTEDYYAANKLMKGYIGTANIDTNSRLCMASAVAGHKRAFGEDVVPGCYEDLELADLIILVGSNAAWCHPVLVQRLQKARDERSVAANTPRIVVIDPRRTATCELADLHLPVRSGTDVWLFNGLLAHLSTHAAFDSAFVAEHTDGVDPALAVARETAGSAEATAAACGVDVERIATFFDWFATTTRVVTVFSQGVNQSSAGTDKVNSIINCHLLTGRIGKPGMGPFSVTGQPNAMGGREVGGLANMLAAHMEIGNGEHRRLVQEFWGSPRIADRAGPKAVELFDAIHAGGIKAVWIMATNPVVSLPDADKTREALSRCELVVVSDCVANTDTNALAHVLLPAAAWGEKDGTVTNSERRISRQRAFLPAAGDARPDWWIVSEVAKRMGYERGFDFASARDVFVEHAALSGVGNEGARVFDIGTLATLSDDDYATFTPRQWPARRDATTDSTRLFADGRFAHNDGKARFVATRPALPRHATSAEFPLVLNTGRMRDQWHTMTRTGTAPRLTSHTPEPFVDLHAHDALAYGVRTHELATVKTRWGSLVARVRTSGEVQRGTVFVPIHWSGAFASDARVGALVNPVVDPLSGEPELKHTPACVEPFNVDWYGFVLSREDVPPPNAVWWTRARGEQFVRYELAGRGKADPMLYWSAWLRQRSEHRDDWLEYIDDSAGTYRAVLLRDDRLQTVIFVSSRAELPSRTWLASLFARKRIGEAERTGLLRGQPAMAPLDEGPIVCSCFGVARGEITAAISKHNLTTAREVGEKLRAGTNCGSCLAEIRRLLAPPG
jgi:assimilatory nitrate reductase catalytic subunit